MFRKNILTILAVVLFVTQVCCYGGPIIYVDDDANGINDGTSWDDAYMYLQDALADANSAEKPVEIRVAQGIYRPDRSSTEPNGTGGRAATFQLINGVTVKGGYAGPRICLLGADPNARDVDLYETILSGDLDDNDIDVNDPALLPWEPTRAENSYHVVTGSRTDETAILDGFIVTAGNADGPWQQGNNRGGGMYNTSSGSMVTIVRNCSFTKNSAGLGGGMCNYNASPTLTNCTFNRNSACDSGGGMYNDHCSPTVTDCIFKGNLAAGWWGYGDGGGMYNYGSGRPTLTNCIFSGNSAAGQWAGGGGMYNLWCSTTLTNCTFSGNSAVFGAAVYIDESGLRITNCIFWDGGNEIGKYDTWTKITYSNVQSGEPGEGNIDADPCFADAANGDYHLKSQAGRWDPENKSWVQDAVTSPCIDAGDTMSPISYEPFPNGGIINMGAYGGTPEASKSSLGAPVCETIVAGDINGDCKVDFKDFAVIAQHWLFDNMPTPPGQASNPLPPDGATGVDVGTVLFWTAGVGAESHDVYFGTTDPPPFWQNRISTLFKPPTPLNRNTTYYWRIDEVNVWGKATGEVWTFRTSN